MNEFEGRKDNEKCVCVNVFVNCDKKDTCGHEMWKKEDCCVEVNIFADCDKKK